MQQVGQHLEMALDPPAAPVGLAALRRRHSAGRFVTSTISVSPSRVGSSSFSTIRRRRCGPLASATSIGCSKTRRWRSGPAAARPAGSKGSVERCQRTRKDASRCDPEQKRAHAEVAVHDPEWPGRRDPVEQGPLLAVGVLLEDQVEDQAAGRLIDRQRHAGQAGRPGGPQGGDAMLGAGQDVAVEDPGRIARDRLGRQAPAGDDELRARGAVRRTTASGTASPCD